MKPDKAHCLTDQELAALEQRIAGEYGKAADEMQDKVDDYFQSFVKRDAEQKTLIGTIVNGKVYTEQDYKQWRLAQIGRGERLEDLRNKLAERMTKANEVAVAYINDATPGIYSLNRNYAAYTIEQQVSAGVAFTLWDEQTVKRLIVENPDIMPYYPPERAVKRGIDLAYGKRQITAQITTGILQGEGIMDIAKRLQKNIPDMNRTSAIRAARTAATGAQNAGRMDSYEAAKRMGIKLRKMWLATLDGRTRHSHAALDGVSEETDKEFSNGCMYPGDPNGPPNEVYNCRCTLIADVDGVDTSDAQRRARDPETGENVLIGNMTYEEWAVWKRKEKESVNIENKTISQYNNTIQRHVSIDRSVAYNEAKNGGRHKGVYADAMKKSKTRLEKSIASHTAQVEEHAAKIADPAAFDTGWSDKDQRAKDGLLRKWGKDMQRNAEQAEIEISVWEERFGNDDQQRKNG